MTGRQPSAPLRILAVCTGNVFRSRIAEHQLRVGLAERLGAAAGSFVVGSAGSAVIEGRPVHPSEAAALARLGMPADQRPSRRLTAADIAQTDLVLCADRSHRSAVLELVPGAMRRTFLLREFARVAGPAIDLSDDPTLRGSDLLVRAAAVVVAANTFRGFVPLDRSAAPDDIADPWDEPADVLAHAAMLVRAAVPAIVDALAPDTR